MPYVCIDKKAPELIFNKLDKFIFVPSVTKGKNKLNGKQHKGLCFQYGDKKFQKYIIDQEIISQIYQKIAHHPGLAEMNINEVMLFLANYYEKTEKKLIIP